MRRLLYVPIVHEEIDLGTAGKALAQQSASLAGEARWARHGEAVRQFWKNLAAYFHAIDPSQLKLYQDGLPAGGAVGRRIVEEAARRGSSNYQLILELLATGAELRQTEDPVLLAQERNNILELLRQPLRGGKRQGAQWYRRQRDQLLSERDKFIAQAINTSLREGEMGALFIGAHHDVVSYLADDILVEALKEPKKVQAYVVQLFSGGAAQRFEELATYLASPVGSHP